MHFPISTTRSETRLVVGRRQRKPTAASAKPTTISPPKGKFRCSPARCREWGLTLRGCREAPAGGLEVTVAATGARGVLDLARVEPQRQSAGREQIPAP